MIVTCQEGNVFRINGAGTVTHIASLFPPGPAYTVEGPAVVPPGFGPHGGEIWVADEDNNAVHAVGLPPTYTVTLNILSHFSAEGVYVIPNASVRLLRQRLLPGGTTAVPTRLGLSAERLRRVGWQRYPYE